MIGDIKSGDRLVAFWLFSVAAMVFLMVVLGGVTRLTGSGLSMVEWRPVTGWLPPLTDIEWQRIFDMYRETPEYREINAGMSIDEFKGIFWLEFLHRLWGRLIGIAYMVPFIYFFAKGLVRGQRALRLGGIFVLGGLQGGLGWFMVKSGLVDQPDVSQYRLAAHLMLALVIYVCLIWMGLRYLQGATPDRDGLVPLRRLSRWVIVMVFITAFSGALVAGLNAGMTYNTFPLMDGDLIPSGMYEMSPLYVNFFENITTVQFDHRLLAVTTFILIMWLWVACLQSDLSNFSRLPMNWLGTLACIQVSLGIGTLLLVVPLALAAMHQAGAVLLLGAATWTLFELQCSCPAPETA